MFEERREVYRKGAKYAKYAKKARLCLPARMMVGMQLPQLVGESKSVADWTKELHEAGGTIGYFLIGLHAAAALFHHYIVRDNTLRRMLPSHE